MMAGVLRPSFNLGARQEKERVQRGRVVGPRGVDIHSALRAFGRQGEKLWALEAR